MTESRAECRGRPRRAAAVLALLVVVAAVGMRLGFVSAPFFADDLSQMAFVAGGGPSNFAFRHDLDLFRFLDGDPEAAQAAMDVGARPWRSDPEQLAAFFRPLSSALMALDHALFGLESVPAHLHSWLWFALYVAVVHRLYRLLLEPAAARLATVLTVVSPVGLLTVKWWAGRYALLTAFFCAAGILFHLRWLRDGRRRDLPLALACLLAALLSGESGTQAFVFLFAVTAVHAHWRPAPLLRLLWPAGLLLLAYLAVRAALGYGVARCALYVDPLGEPGAYLRGLLSGFHLALGGATFSRVREGDTPPIPATELVPAAVLLAVVAVAAWRGRARLREAAAPGTRLGGLLLGSLLALCLCFASRSALRPWTYMVPQLGLFAVLATLLVAAWRTRAAVPRAAVLLLGAVCLVAPLRTYVWTIASTRELREHGSPEALRACFPDDVRRAITDRTTRLVFVRSPWQALPSSFLAVWYGLELAAGGRLTTATLSDTAGAPARCTLTRTGPRSLRLESTEPLLRANDIYRFDERFPLRAGQTIALAGLTVTVREVREWRGPQGAPVLDRVYAAEFAFGGPLDGPDTLFLTWAGDRFELLALPRVGESAAVP